MDGGEGQLVEYLSGIDMSQCAELESLSERLIEQLPEGSLRQVALLRLAGHSNAEIAAELGCVTRTVERKLALIRSIWTRE